MIGKVIKKFIDKTTNKRFTVNDEYSANANRIKHLVKLGFIEADTNNLSDKE
jgi:hypothetical protein